MKDTLSTLIGNYFLKRNASINLITELILALIKVRDVNLTELALCVCEQCKLESAYRRLQRFFANCSICGEALAKLLVKLLRIEGDKWLLVLDRTNWAFGKLKINILVLAICYRGIAVPILFCMLDNKGGNSSSQVRENLLTKFISIFGKKRIKGLIADREFIGDDWLNYLTENGINFYIRIRANITIGRTEKELTTANQKVKKLQNNEYLVLPGQRYLGKSYKGPKVKIAACRNNDGELVIIATNDNPDKALEIYKQRWEIETLFGCLKTRGFNFENTHMNHLDRIETMLALLSITFTFSYVVGTWRHSIVPIKLKKHQRKAQSFFRYGLDHLRKILFYLEQMTAQSQEIIEHFFNPIITNFNRFNLC